MSYRVYGEPVEPPRARVERALRAWSGFPASRDPRSLVVLDPAVREGGFPDVTAKLAFIRGAIDAAPGFPAAILQVLCAHRQDHDGPRLLVTTTSQGQAEFATDRGRRALPAWRVRAQGVPEAITVLDPAVSQQAWWPRGPDLPGWRRSTAVLSDHGRTVTLRFIGSPYADYPGAEVLEAGAAVAVLPTEVDTGPPGPRLAVAAQREVSVTLADPLGPRVLLDQGGAPVMVQA